MNDSTISRPHVVHGLPGHTIKLQHRSYLGRNVVFELEDDGALVIAIDLLKAVYLNMRERERK